MCTVLATRNSTAVLNARRLTGREMLLFGFLSGSCGASPAILPLTPTALDLSNLRAERMRGVRRCTENESGR